MVSVLWRKREERVWCCYNSKRSWVWSRYIDIIQVIYRQHTRHPKFVIQDSIQLAYNYKPRPVTLTQLHNKPSPVTLQIFHYKPSPVTDWLPQDKTLQKTSRHSRRHNTSEDTTQHKNGPWLIFKLNMVAGTLITTNATYCIRLKWNMVRGFDGNE